MPTRVLPTKLKTTFLFLKSRGGQIGSFAKRFSINAKMPSNTLPATKRPIIIGEFHGYLKKDKLNIAECEEGYVKPPHIVASKIMKLALTKAMFPA